MSERLLRRASELDVANRSGAEVAKLRAAAAEAGISHAAFDAALAELREEQSAQVAAPAALPRRRFPVWAIVVGTIAVLFAIFVTMRTVVPVPAVATVEQAFTLRCMSPDQAVALVRPLLQDGKSTVQASPGASGTITIRTSPAQMGWARAALESQDAADSPACATPRP